ncbi:MAG: hypothetical protein R2792_00300 [Saprospiraceae bacterium]
MELFKLFPGIIGVFLCVSVQAQIPDSCTGQTPVIPDSTVQNQTPPDSSNQGFWSKTQLSGGQLTLPFKIRPNARKESFNLTTDVTLGGYIGMRHPLNEDKNYFLTIPLTAGLTFVNYHGQDLPGVETEQSEIIPGLSWSTGVILQLNQYSLGLLLGKDYASEVGNQWKYHSQLWWSFGIGFAFIQ